MTCDRIARLIRREFRVRYHRDHIGRLMHQLGWSYQKPERRALERDDEAIDRWKRRTWPRVKKTALLQFEWVVRRGISPLLSPHRGRGS